MDGWVGRTVGEDHVKISDAIGRFACTEALVKGFEIVQHLIAHVVPFGTSMCCASALCPPTVSVAALDIVKSRRASSTAERKSEYQRDACAGRHI